MTNDQNDHILTALDALIRGDSMPSMRDPSFGILMGAIDALTCDTQGEAARQQIASQRQVAMCALKVLHAQLVASMHAERELTLMRQGSRPL